MGYQTPPYPAVVTNEQSLVSVIQAASGTVGGIAGVFNWGPVGVITEVANETVLAKQFGAPNNNNPETYFTTASFLAYGDACQIARAANCSTSNVATSALNAYGNTATLANTTGINVVRNDHEGPEDLPNLDPNIIYLARYPANFGNGIRVSVCDSVNAYSSSLAVSNNTVTGNVAVTPGSNVVAISATATGSGTALDANTMLTNVIAGLSVGDLLPFGNSTIGTQYLKITALPGTPNVVGNTATINVSVSSPFTLRAPFYANSVTRYWEFYNQVQNAPGLTPYVAARNANSAVIDQIHVVVVDQAGNFAPNYTPGQVLEVYQSLSRATDALNASGSSVYYKNVINQQSKYTWQVNDRAAAPSAPSASILSSTASSVLNLQFQGGSDGYNEGNVTLSELGDALDLFANKLNVNVNLLMQGKAVGAGGTQLSNYIINNVAMVRKDLVSFLSPPNSAVVNNRGNEATSILGWRNQLTNSSYWVADSGYKYMYDKYNDLYRWIPLNGDVAGCCSFTDTVAAPWFSPGGYNRGQIKNCVKLAYNPKATDQALLYPAQINPVISEPGEGTILFGDRTGDPTGSLFDRINIRRLFITLEKTINTYAKYQLFEFNDSETQAAFENLVNPYLRGVQGARGITKFYVDAGSDVNTADVVAAKQFVGNIWVLPNFAINWIILNFNATDGNVQFSYSTSNSGPTS